MLVWCVALATAGTGSNYVEIDVDIQSSAVARSMAASILSYCSALTIDEAFVVENFQASHATLMQHSCNPHATLIQHSFSTHSTLPRPSLTLTFAVENFQDGEEEEEGEEGEGGGGGGGAGGGGARDGGGGGPGEPSGGGELGPGGGGGGGGSGARRRAGSFSDGTERPLCQIQFKHARARSQIGAPAHSTV